MGNRGMHKPEDIQGQWPPEVWCDALLGLWGQGILVNLD